MHEQVRRRQSQERRSNAGRVICMRLAALLNLMRRSSISLVIPIVALDLVDVDDIVCNDDGPTVYMLRGPYY